MFVMLRQCVPHLKCTRVVNYHGGALAARRKPPAVMRELEEPDLSGVDVELQDISPRKLVSVTHMIGKERWRGC